MNCLVIKKGAYTGATESRAGLNEAASGGNRTKAAKALGIDRVSLWRKLEKYGMDEIE
ncbi:MAG: helix-turn-helix domain-containing protein [Candidatus Thiodiazotropha sp. LLP2]